jgi:CrcB protein
MNTDLERIFTPLLFVGFLGAFTTFSAFTRESLELINSGLFLYTSVYIVLTVFSCLIATWLGMFLTKG